MSDRLPSPERGETIIAFERASATPARIHPSARARGGSAAVTSLPRPTSLRATQEWLVRAIADAPADLAVDDVITAGPRMSAAARLDVYQSGYLARLVECLQDDYPVVAASLGGDRFEALCHAYVARNPSTGPNLNPFGRHMASFCREADPALLDERERAFYAELAALEWALVELIHAPASTSFDLAALQSMPPERWATATFVRSEAVRIFSFAHPVNAFYRACRESEDGKHPPLPAPEPTWTVAYRSGGTLWRMDLTRAMFGVLNALLEGAPLGDALGQINVDEQDPEAVAEAERSVMIWFREWVSGGLFAELRVG